MIADLRQPIERSDRRVLGGFRFVDAATGEPIRRPLVVTAGHLTARRNRRGVYVIERAPGLETVTGNFDRQPQPPNPPTAPAVGSSTFTLTVEDPRGRWLPRAFDLALPRDADPGAAGDSGSLFQALETTLYPAAGAPVEPTWALLRATLRRQGAPLGGALVEVTVPAATTDDAPIVRRGMTDWRGRTRGEALVAVPGVRFLRPAEGNGNGNGTDENLPVLTRTVPVTVRVILDPTFAPDAGDLPDPDRLLAEAGQLETATFEGRELTAGHTLTLDESL